MTKPVVRNSLHLVPPMRVLVLNPPAEFRELVKPLSPEITVVSAGKADAAVAFVKTKPGANRLAARVLKAIPRDGLLWFCYPKGRSGVKTELNRNILWKALAARHGIRPVTVRSLGPVWTTMRFRPVELVGKT
jgi:hypothetical protein